MAHENLDQEIIELLVSLTGEDELGEYRDVDLFEEEVLDSLGAIEVLVALKKQFGVAIAPTELEREDMNTVDKIIERVRERL